MFFLKVSLPGIALEVFSFNSFLQEKKVHNVSLFFFFLTFSAWEADRLPFSHEPVSSDWRNEQRFFRLVSGLKRHQAAFCKFKHLQLVACGREVLLVRKFHGLVRFLTWLLITLHSSSSGSHDRTHPASSWLESHQREKWWELTSRELVTGLASIYHILSWMH